MMAAGGHAGGGGGNRSDLFPKPLSADEVAARTKAVVANVDPSMQEIFLMQ